MAGGPCGTVQRFCPPANKSNAHERLQLEPGCAFRGKWKCFSSLPTIIRCIQSPVWMGGDAGSSWSIRKGSRSLVIWRTRYRDCILRMLGNTTCQIFGIIPQALTSSAETDGCPTPAGPVIAATETLVDVAVR